MRTALGDDEPQADGIDDGGIAFDPTADAFIVVDRDEHCVRRVDRGGAAVATLAGHCGEPGDRVDFLNDPTHAIRSPASGAPYVADTGNHRVLRIDGDEAAVVVGDGSVSSAGEGRPARSFPVNAPCQLGLDPYGNLYVASTTTVRPVENVDGDVDADGDDRVATLFGGGARDAFPESDTFCLGALIVADDGSIAAADACQGFAVRVTPTTR